LGNGVSDNGDSDIRQVHVSELQPTHPLTLSRRERELLRQDIRAHGILTPLEYIVHNGTKYVVDGHHRRQLAILEGIETVPAIERTLPHGMYRGPEDLIFARSY
jgi:ParB-like chromosome segregation protein Spo0J